MLQGLPGLWKQGFDCEDAQTRAITGPRGVGGGGGVGGGVTVWTIISGALLIVDWIDSD